MVAKSFSVATLFFIVLYSLVSIAFAQEFQSTNFRILDPVPMPGIFGSSDTFRLFSNINQIAIGTSTATNFKINSGFFYYPFASSPVVTATAGNGQVALSWSASSGVLGWTVSSYNVGQSLSSDGPYTYTSLGNVTSSTRTGLTNGTAYYFVIRAEDALGNSVATSTQVSSTPVAPTETTTTTTTTTSSGGGGSGGGGGGGVFSPYVSGVVVSGRAYPLSAVTLLKDGQIAASTIAGPDSNFKITLLGISAGDYIFSLYGKDKNGSRSTLFNFPITLTAGATTDIGGVFIAPTISIDKSEVKKGDNIAFFGQSAAKSEVAIVVSSSEEFLVKTGTDKDGIYLYNFDTSVLDYGGHNARSKAALNGLVSNFSNAVNFKVGARTVLAPKLIETIVAGDPNSDGKIDLVDFSILAYWYKRPLSSAFKLIEREKLNGDGKIDLVDFSIMAFYWTG